MVLKTELPHLAGGGANHNCSCRTKQLPPGENNSSEHLAGTGCELPQAPVTTCHVDGKNQILFTSQSPGKTTSELITHGPQDQGKQKKQKEKNPSSCLHPSCLTRGAVLFSTKPRIPSTNTQIGCQRNNSRTFTKQTELFVVAVPGVFSFFLSFFLYY
jgi:hypothetical protein